MSHPSTHKRPGASGKIESYRAFWPYYLREHSKARTRNIHFLGTGGALLALLAALATQNAWLLPLALLLGYGPAWYAHFFVEKNRPATFQYPLWSLFSDVRMAALWASGQLSGALENAGLGPTEEDRG